MDRNETAPKQSRLVREYFVGEARKSAAELRGDRLSALDVDSLVDTVQQNLEKAGAGLAALDPTGRTSEQAAGAKLARDAKNANLRGARAFFRDLTPDGMGCMAMEGRIKEIGHSLAAARVGLEALDPKGKKSADQIKEEIGALIVRCPAPPRNDKVERSA